MGIRRAAVALGFAALLALPASAGARNMYATAFTSDEIASFDVLESGIPQPLTPAVFPTADEPAGIVIAPNGGHVYVAHQTGSEIRTYPIGTAGGLGAPAVTGFPAVDNPTVLAISPDGTDLYSSNYPARISVFDVAPNGLLTSRDPIPITGATAFGLAVHPNGEFLYATTGGGIRGFQIAADGTATPLSGSPFGGAGNWNAIALAPDGAHLYAVRPAEQDVVAFGVESDGALTALSDGTAAVGNNPSGIAISPDGTRLYVANRDNDHVSGFLIGPDGRLTPAVGSPYSSVPELSQPAGLAMTPDGSFLEIWNDSSPSFVKAMFSNPNGSLISLGDSTGVGAEGAFATQSIAIVPNQGPVAALSATDSFAGVPITFHAEGSTDPDGAIARYDWDFGDGTTASTTQPTTDHTYSQPGSYTASVTVTDDEGCSDEMIFTGQTAHCNSGAAARGTAEVEAADGEVSFVIRGKKLKLTKRGRLPIRLHCPETELSGPCQGKLKLKPRKKVEFKGKRRKPALAGAKFKVSSGTTKKVNLKPSAAKLALIRTEPKARRAVASAKVRDQAGNSAVVKKRLKISP